MSEFLNMDSITDNNVNPNSVDFILEDMPYNITSCKWEVEIDLSTYWESRLRILKPNGLIALTAVEPFTSELIMSNRKMFKYDWVWEKTHPKGHLNAKRMPLRAHESVLIFYSESPTYNAIKTTGHIRKIAKTSYKKPFDGNSVYGAENRNTNYDSTERYPRSVIEFSNADLTEVIHPTQKPVALFEYLIQTYTNPGEMVFDGFTGSGTTAIACINSGRNYIIYEKDPDYYKAACERIKNHEKQIVLFDPKPIIKQQSIFEQDSCIPEHL